MSIKDLNRGDRIRMQEVNGVEITVLIKKCISFNWVKNWVKSCYRKMGC
ncbi:hypothetical protein ACUXIA_000105 [Staphylococcus epidermidis]